MENNEFKISNSKGSQIITTIMILLIEIVVTFSILQRTDRVLLILIVFHVSFTPLGILILLNDLFFRVDVSSEKIKVRTQFGKKYQFTIADIKSVKCEKTVSTKGAAHFFIDIVTKTEKLQLYNSLKGFDTMAEYLLDKLYTGEIDKKVISDSCEKILIRYKNNDYRNKISDEDVESQYEDD